MNVSSSAAASALRVSLQRQGASAHDIANTATPGYRQMVPRQTETGTGPSVDFYREPGVDPEFSSTDTATEAVEQRSDLYSLKANAAVLRAQDRITGEVLDLFA